MNLLDEIMPTWEFGNHHQIVIDAPPERVAGAMESLDLSRDVSWIVRALFRARGLPFPSGPTPRDALLATGFSVLLERPNLEIVFGIAGKFWAPREMANLVHLDDARAFKEFAAPGRAKGAINFRIEPHGHGRTLFSTETRVSCVDGRARALFAIYWTLIRIPSGIIRKDLLRAVARRASAPVREVAA